MSGRNNMTVLYNITSPFHSGDIICLDEDTHNQHKTSASMLGQRLGRWPDIEPAS